MLGYRVSCLLATLVVVLIAAHAEAEQQKMWNETWTDKLKRDLFVKYDKFARPAQHYNTTVVYFDISILHLSVDEFKSTVTVNAWASHAWTDEKLKWNASMYGGVRYIHVGNHEIWQPDIVLYNSGTGNTVEHYGDTLCIVSNEGRIIWVPPAQFVALCDLDLRLWPFDVQHCTLKLGSWTNHINLVDLRLDKKWTDDMQYLSVRNAAWTLENVTKTRKEDFYACCEEAYVTLNFDLTLKRNNGLYFNVFVIPTLAITLLALSMFWLSPDSEMKFTLSACTTLIISLYLVYFGVKIPLSLSTPLIVHFYTGSLCVVAISLTISMMVLHITRKPYYKPLPRNVRLLLMNWPGKLLGLSDFIAAIESHRPMPAQEMRGKLTEEFAGNSSSNIADDCDRHHMISPSKNSTQLEWLMAGTAVDRLAFLIFCVAFVLMQRFCVT